jgi:RNA polymerase sigma-70 factor, ECF subfamily
MHGSAAIARALVAFYGQVEEWGLTLVPAHVNGQPGFRSLDADGRIVNVVGLDIEGGRVRAVHSMLNPEKLRHLGPVSDVALRPSAR